MLCCVKSEMALNAAAGHLDALRQQHDLLKRMLNQQEQVRPPVNFVQLFYLEKLFNCSVLDQSGVLCWSYQFIDTPDSFRFFCLSSTSVWFCR